MSFVSEFKAVSLGRTQGFAVDAAKNYGACASWLGDLGGVFFQHREKMFSSVSRGALQTSLHHWSSDIPSGVASPVRLGCVCLVHSSKGQGWGDEVTLCCLRLSWPPSSRRGSERARPPSWPLPKTHLVAGCADGLPSTHRQYPGWRVGTLGELYLFFIYLRVRHVSLNQGEYSTTGNSLPQSSIP